MGKLIYGAHGDEIDIADRLMAHLQTVILSKLRRSECFAFSFQHGQETGGGRSTIWMHPTIPLHFKYSGSKAPTINRAWLDLLVQAANSSAGLRPVDEPAESTA